MRIGMDALDELAELPQWIYWRREPPRPGSTKPVKMPYDPRTGRHASTTDPATWAPFDVALTACQERGGTGIGFVFSSADPYMGVDLDGCIDTETGAVAEWAISIVGRLDSYTERSPSETGLHVIVRAVVPAGGNRRGAIELYDTGRYFTMTGQPYPGTPAGIREAQPELSALHQELFGTDDVEMQTRRPRSRGPVAPDDADVLARMFGARNGDRIRRLWDGDLSRFGGDDSAADFALCAHLTYWMAGDRDRADRLFRQSALYRRKWDEKRGQTTYGARTLARVGGQQPAARGPIEL